MGAAKSAKKVTNIRSPITCIQDLILQPTQIEEMLIAPVHALLQVWQVRGGQTKYTGHTCNFPWENAVFHTKVPLLPEQCDVIIMCRAGLDMQNEEQVFQDFRVW